MPYMSVSELKMTEYKTAELTESSTEPAKTAGEPRPAKPVRKDALFSWACRRPLQ